MSELFQRVLDGLVMPSESTVGIVGPNVQGERSYQELLLLLQSDKAL